MNIGHDNQINENDKENDIDIMFNTNQKNFFKFRKDIIEEPANEEEDRHDDLQHNIYNTKNEKKNSIHFPEIYKYFLKFS